MQDMGAPIEIMIGDVVKQMAFALSTPFDSAQGGGD